MAATGSARIPQLVGILNLTADSFSDGGQYPDSASAVAAAMEMLRSGADVIDIGAESTRPGAKAISIEDQLTAILPVLHELREQSDCSISVDTRSAAVADAVLNAGADTINDVSGLRFDPALAEVAAKHRARLVLTHSRGIPETMQRPEFLQYPGGLTEEINAFFAEQICFAETAGVGRDKIILDPGIGFSKTPEQNFELIRRAEDFRRHGLPLYYGVSRKAFLKPCCGTGNRDFATAGVLAVLTLKHIEYLRVHYITGARDAVCAAAACAGAENDKK